MSDAVIGPALDLFCGAFCTGYDAARSETLSDNLSQRGCRSQGCRGTKPN